MKEEKKREKLEAKIVATQETKIKFTVLQY